MFNWESSNKIISFSQDKNQKNQAESIAADPQELQMLENQSQTINKLQLLLLSLKQQNANLKIFAGTTNNTK